MSERNEEMVELAVKMAEAFAADDEAKFRAARKRAHELKASFTRDEFIELNRGTPKEVLTAALKGMARWKEDYDR